MNKQIETANHFVDAMLKAEGSLKAVKETIATSKHEVEELLSTFATQQKSIVESVKSSIHTPQAKILFENYKTVVDDAVVENAKKHKLFMKSTSFINKFDETFIVSVFGKVKSGKSYLGNYIMGNAFKKNKISSCYDNLDDITVFVEDRGKLTTVDKLSESMAENEGMGFGVAAVEATSTIQYFKIGGLTWFDSPGIGSITRENEELAEEYVKNSDLVIFCMNSDAAGTRQELDELINLAKMGKPLLLLITQSDEMDFDDDFEPILVAKSAKDRSDVEKYILNRITEEGITKALELGNGKVLTISTKLASEALANPKRAEEMYDISNMDEFLNRLIAVTEGKSAELKAKNPRDRFNKFISELTLNLSELSEKINALNAEAEQQEKNANEIKKRVINEISYHTYDVIHNTVMQKATTLKNGESISGATIAAEISSEINRIIIEKCNEALVEIIPDISKLVSANTLSSEGMEIGDLGEKKVSSTYDVDVVHRSRVSGGLIQKIKDLLCGPEYYTTVEKEQRSIEVVVGDNSADIEAILMQYFGDMCENTVSTMISNIIDGCNKPIREIAAAFEKLTEQTKNKLNTIKL